MSENFNINSMGKACKDSKYVEFIKKTVKNAMNGQKSISLNKAISIFQQYNNELDENDLIKIKQIAMKDGNEDVNEREMATIYTLLDAELGSDNKFHMDGKIGSKKVKFGLNEAYENEIKDVYDTFKTAEDIETEKQQQLKIKNAAIAKTKEIVGEYPEVNIGKYAQMNLVAEIPLDNNFNSFKEALNKRGINYTEKDNGTITYKVGDKTCITENSDGMCITTVKDKDGNTVQTIRSSGVRDETNGILVTNYSDGKKQNSTQYSSDKHEFQEVTEYNYDINGNLKQEVSQDSHYTFVTKYQNNKYVQYRMDNNILFFIDDNNEKITQYTEQDLVNLSK